MLFCFKNYNFFLNNNKNNNNNNNLLLTKVIYSNNKKIETITDVKKSFEKIIETDLRTNKIIKKVRVEYL